MVKVRTIKIGEGIPKICIPIVGTTKEEIKTQAEHILEFPADMVEWRADWYESGTCAEKVSEVLHMLRGILGELPILFTFRTALEGGMREVSEAEYEAVTQAASESGQADLIDIELSVGDTAAERMAQNAHKRDIRVIMSSHDFKRTPKKQEIVKKLQKMESLHADIAKIAVMPETEEDVLTLLSASVEAKNSSLGCPVVTMSMGAKGVLSRVCGEFSGSAITFAAAGKSSAPGQMDAVELSEILKIMHKSV